MNSHAAVRVFHAALLGVALIRSPETGLASTFFQPWKLAIEQTGDTAHLQFSGDHEARFRLEDSATLDKWRVLADLDTPGPAVAYELADTAKPRQFFRLYRLLPLVGGPPIDYVESGLAFDPDRWRSQNVPPEMFPYEGDEVVFLANERWLDEGSLDPYLMASFVGQLDAGWRVYADILGRRPNPFKELNGKPTIAAIPASGYELTCGWGCGYLGFTGIEVIAFYALDWPAHVTDPLSFAHYYFYEMGRNFYLFDNRHSVFTTGFAVFMRYVCMDSLGLTDPDLSTRRLIDQREADYAASAVDWFGAFTGPGGDRLGLPVSDPNVIYASIMLALRRELGDDWLRRFCRELFTCPRGDSGDINGQLVQALNWVVAANLAAGRDLTPRFTDRWKFPLPAATVTALAGVDWAGARSAGRAAGTIILQEITQYGPELLANGSFEEGLDHWTVLNWLNRPEHASVVDSGDPLHGHVLYLTALEHGDDLSVRQPAFLTAGKQYRLTGWVRTRDVQRGQPDAETGANLCRFNTWECVSVPFGTQDWSFLTMDLRVELDSEVEVAARLGFWASFATGEAWFDTLSLREILE